MEQFLSSSPGQLLFMIIWTGLASLAAWYGISRLRKARRTRQFGRLFFVLKESERPFAFKFEMAFLSVWAGLACLFVLSGLWAMGYTLLEVIGK